MAHRQTIDISSERRRLDELGPLVARLALIVGLAGLAAGVVLGLLLHGFRLGEFLRAALKSYLVNYTFCLSLALGALFFVLIQHLTRAGWSVAVRRLAEGVATALPPLALLALPIVLGMRELYPWVNPDGFIGTALVDKDEAHLVHAKEAYLNVGFFLVRLALYFAVWSWLALAFFRTSVAQDSSGDPALTSKMQRLSAPGIILFGLTLTLAAFDLLMSINPVFFSTIFGVYFFAGCVVSFMALLILGCFLLQRTGRLRLTITTEHYHDMGKLMWGFMVFWTYIAFSQFMLIWYANLPEETFWYRARMYDATGSWSQWGVFSLILLLGHFVIPFLALISRYPKRATGLLALGAGWILAMHWLDLYYLVMPVVAGPGRGVVPLGLLLMDVAFLAGVGGLFVSAVVSRLSRVSLIPERDPRLPESLAFENY